MNAVGRLKDALCRMETAFCSEPAGLQAAASLSDAVDMAVRRIWESTGGPTSATALVAIGGYGRRHMCPQSDIDLLVLSRRGIKVEQAVRGLSYALWDAGFQLGFLTATEKEAHKLASSDIDARCAQLDARLVWGDGELFEEFRRRSVREARRAGDKFRDKLRQVSEERWSAAGDAGAELEPDLKRSKGGLRDLAALGWIGQIGDAGQAPEEPARLQQALDLLLAVRWALHLETKRPTDLLSMQLQIPVARRLQVDEYELMRRLYESCRPVGLAMEDLLLGPDRFERAAKRFAGIFLNISSARVLCGNGAAAADRPAEKEQMNRGPSRSGQGAVPADQPVYAEWPAEARESFGEILRAGGEGRRAFRAIDVAGAFQAALPEWAQIRCRAQRNIYHRWAVDVHCYETVCQLVDLRHSEDDLVKRVAADSKKDWDSLLLAGLLHDIGKGGGEDHSLAGERLADICASRIGFRASATRDVSWLVKHHLLLPQVATRRDISEEALIVDLAERVGSERRLRMLYLLSVADARATGPAAWTPWTANLVSQLFSEVNHLLERKELVGGDASVKAAGRTADLKASLASKGPGTVERHLAAMPRAWLLSQTPAALLRQSELMLQPPTGEVYLEAQAEGQEGIWEVTVVAPDRPGLFSKVSGALALHGCDVVSAQIFTREDGLALEVFRVAVTSDRQNRFEQIAADVTRAIKGEISLREALDRKRRDYAGRVQKGRQEPPEVIVDNRASDFYTVIEVHATDRIGLLYEITAALADLGMDIHLAKVATYAEDIVDSFYVRDLEGQKVTDPDRLISLKARVLEAVASAGTDSM